jgi:predicted Zn-dependent peptidase
MSFQASKTSKGLSVVTYSMPHINSVSINIIVKVGSRYETISEAGISHFLEHMAFKGTTNRSASQIAQEFDTIGGHFNAYTSKENTVYYTKVLSQHTQTALDILADILQNSLFSPDEITKEFSVISQEIAEVNDNPDDLVHEKFYSLAYGNHPLGQSILGNIDNIAKFSHSSFQNYIKKHYTTDNIVISIAGKVEHNKILKQIEQLFSSIEPGRKQDYLQAKYAGGYALNAKDLEQTTIALGFEGVSYARIEPFYHAQILAIIFGGGLSSRLFQKIREELGLAYSVGSWLNSYSDSGIFSIYAAAEHNKINCLLRNIGNEIDKIQEYISEQELARAKSQIETNIYMAEEKSEYKSEEIGRNYSLFQKYTTVDEVMNIVFSTKISDLVSSARLIFSSKPTLSVVGPTNLDIDPGIISKNW